MVSTQKLTKQRILFSLENWLRSFHAGRHLTWLHLPSGFSQLWKIQHEWLRAAVCRWGGDIARDQFPNFKSHTVPSLFQNSYIQAYNENIDPFSKPFTFLFFTFISRYFPFLSFSFSFPFPFFSFSLFSFSLFPFPFPLSPFPFPFSYFPFSPFLLLALLFFLLVCLSSYPLLISSFCLFI